MCVVFFKKKKKNKVIDNHWNRLGTVEGCAEKYPGDTLFILHCFPRYKLSVVFKICSQLPSDNFMLTEFTRA